MQLQSKKSALIQSVPHSIPDSQQSLPKCLHYPSLEKDTICFNQTCRQAHTQIFYSFCDHERQLHNSHIREQFAIHRTSPAFRLIDCSYSQQSERILAANIEECNQTIKDIQVLFQSLLEQAASKYFAKIQCLSDFLSKDAAFKICSKVRHQSSQHQKCCIQVLNKLKDLEDAGRVAVRSLEEILLRQAEREKVDLKEQMNHIYMQIKELFSTQKERKRPTVEHQVYDARTDFQQREASSPKHQQIDQSEVKIGIQPTKRQEESIPNQAIKECDSVEESHHGSHKEGKGRQIIFDRELLNSNEAVNVFQRISKIEQNEMTLCEPETKSIIIHLTQLLNQDNKQMSQNCTVDDKATSSCLEVQIEKNNDQNKQAEKNKVIFYQKYAVSLSELQINQKEARTKSTVKEQNKSFEKINGVEFIKPNIARIWKQVNTLSFHKDVLNYLSICSQAKQLVIESQAFSSIAKIKQILNCMSWLQGIHIHCSYRYDRYLDHIQVKQFSIFPTYRFLRLIDKAKYFNCARTDLDKRRKLVKMLNLKEKAFYNKMYIYQSKSPIVPSTVEQLQFFSANRKFTLSPNILQIDSTNQLAVLSFINVAFAPKPDFQHVFTDCLLLHTLVFEDCIAKFNEIIQQFKHLKALQLKHLQISCDGLDKKVILAKQATAQIFRLQFLQTLILTNIQFVKSGRQKSVPDSSVLKGINNLRELTYLNLYSSEPVYNDLLTYINKDCYKKMEMINIGCSQVTKGVGKLLQKFINLKSLCVDYTSIDDEEMLDATKEMEQLRYLCIENLNGKPIIYEQEEYNNRNNYGKVTPYFFDKMRHKHLQYINIYNCDSLKGYLWSQFKQLECIRVSDGIYSYHQFCILARKRVSFANFRTRKSLNMQYLNSDKLQHEDIDDNEHNDNYQCYDSKASAINKLSPHKYVLSKTNKSRQTLEITHSRINQPKNSNDQLIVKQAKVE